MKQYWFAQTRKLLVLSFMSISAIVSALPVSCQDSARIISKTLSNMGVSKVMDVTQAMVNNGRYKFDEGGRQYIKLKEGNASGKFPNAPETWSLSVTNTAFGDLNDDGHKDAAVILGNNGGGNGFFYHLIPVVAINGQLTQIGDVSLGDRINVNNLQIKSGTIITDLTIHGPNDPMVSPTKHVVWKFKINKDKLMKLSD